MPGALIQPLGGQLGDPYLLAAVAWHAVFALWAAAVFLWAPRERKLVGLVSVAALLSVSLATFDHPRGVYAMDTAENMRLFAEHRDWRYLWLEDRAAYSQGFSFVPTYLFNRLTGTFMGERVVGLAHHTLLVLALAAVLPGGAAAAAVGCLLAAVAPTTLSLSRHNEGTVLLLQQCMLIHALNGLRARSRVRSYAALTVALGALSYAYMPSRITWSYPAIWLWRRPKRMLLAYACLAVALVPLLAVPRLIGARMVFRLLPSQIKHAEYRLPDLEYAKRSLGSLVLGSYGGEGTWSYPGVQALPWTGFAAAAAGSVLAPHCLAAALAGDAPDLFSSHNAARSHRQMYVFLPAVFLAAHGAALLPAPAAVATAAAVAGEAIFRWWRLWYREPLRAGPWRWPNGYDGLYPCRDLPEPPAWCPQTG